MATICTMVPPPPSSIWLPNTWVIAQVAVEVEVDHARPTVGAEVACLLRELTAGVVHEHVDLMATGKRFDGRSVTDVDHVDHRPDCLSAV